MAAIYRYLLFDLDGTLVDSVRDLTTTLNLLGTELGHPPLSVAEVRTIVGDGAGKLIKRAFGEKNYRRSQLLRFLDIYGEHLLDTTCCYPGIEDFLAGHPAEKMALVTNKPYRLTLQLLDGLNLLRHFHIIIGGDSCPEKKPHPLPVLKALAALDCKPDQAVMIGDHHTDLYSGRDAGTATCFCSYGLGQTGGVIPDFTAEASTDLRQLFPGPLA